mgnify:CR=1 FL=1
MYQHLLVENDGPFATITLNRPAKLNALTPEMALRIEKAFGPSMEHLLRMQLAYDVARMRRLKPDPTCG